MGASLGVDLLCVNSICSFNCSYCQLGSIQVRIRERRLFVPTEQVLADLARSAWRKAAIVTYSGSGEPTLASNLGEAIVRVAEFTGLPSLVLTNGTLLDLTEVRRELALADRVYVKLDAATEATFQRVNRPVAGLTLAGVVEGLRRFREEYSGQLGIQTMLVHATRDSTEAFAAILETVRPDEIQVNSPTRPYPSGWYVQSRGSHEGVDYPARPLKPVPAPVLESFASDLRRLCPWLLVRVVAQTAAPPPAGP
ncbi:MAG: hypothetical protein Kow001_18440 [Acidobacteriota bacterium]